MRGLESFIRLPRSQPVKRSVSHSPLADHDSPDELFSNEGNFLFRRGRRCFLRREHIGHTWPEQKTSLTKPGHKRRLIRQLKGRKGGNKEASFRPVSTGKLNVSPRLHLRPINLVVYKGPYACAKISYLEAGFPLRCFQRLSLPNVAILLCSWRNNRLTRGSSIPVLSY